MVLNEIAMAFLSNIIIYYIMVFFVFIAAVTFMLIPACLPAYC